MYSFKVFNLLKNNITPYQNKLCTNISIDLLGYYTVVGQMQLESLPWDYKTDELNQTGAQVRNVCKRVAAKDYHEGFYDSFIANCTCSFDGLTPKSFTEIRFCHSLVEVDGTGGTLLHTNHAEQLLFLGCETVAFYADLRHPEIGFKKTQRYLF